MNKYIRCFSELSNSQLNLMKKGLPKKKCIDGVEKIILVSSAKGGVGKSTIAANLAISLIDKTPNKSVGLLDADLFGPSQPHLFQLKNIQPEIDRNNLIQPLSNFGVKVISIGFLIDSNAAVVWRGLMVMSAIEKLLYQVNWGNIDCLVIDMPPGTGDVQLSICQRLPVNGAILVTTPHQLSVADVTRGWSMFQTMKIPVLGYVKNMCYFTCPNCNLKHEIFGNINSNRNLFDEKLDMIGEFPIENRNSVKDIVDLPITIKDPICDISQCYKELAGIVWTKMDSK